MVKTATNRRRCTFPHCNNMDRLHNVGQKIRFKVLKQTKICIPDGARVCEQHLQMNEWSTLNGHTDHITKFSAKQVEDMIQLLTDSRSKIGSEFPGPYECFSFVRYNSIRYSQVFVALMCFTKIVVPIPNPFSTFLFKDWFQAFEHNIFTRIIFSLIPVIHPQNTKTIKVYTGLDADQFNQILNMITPIMSPSFKNLETLELALYVYLMKMKTNHTTAVIAPHFSVTEAVVCKWIKKMRELLHQSLVPSHLSDISRRDLLGNVTELSRKIYSANNNTVILTVDGTYVYTIKSSNFEFQKNSYSKQMKRNLVKFMTFVTTNGLLAAVYGPFDARKNDATILREILNQPGTIFDELLAGDILVVDRGFRDVTADLINLGLIVKSPKGKHF